MRSGANVASVGPGGVVNLNTPDHYFHWGFILVSTANLLVIAAMVVLFCLAILLPFLHTRSSGTAGGRAGGGSRFVADRPAGAVPATGPSEQIATDAAPDSVTERVDEGGSTPQSAGTWTGGLRRLGLRLLPPGKLLPDTQPAYVASWVYVFGVLTLAGLLVAIASGLVLALEGPTWWHTSPEGHFVNSLHLWSVELFMGFMAIHLWGKFWMAAWRGRRQATWITGVLAFLVAVVEAFTGYLSQTNFDAQWIAFEAKDAFNASGAGWFFNAMNFGQALMLHIVFVPLVLVVIVAVHILLVRIRGVVHPIDALPTHTGWGDTVAGEPVTAGTEHAAAPSRPTDPPSRASLNRATEGIAVPAKRPQGGEPR